MEDSYIIENFHVICRLCLNKSSLMMSIFSDGMEDDVDAVTTKITNCSELMIDPSDGLPARICYKCLYKLNKCCKFKLQCIQSENKLKQIMCQVSKLRNESSDDTKANSHAVQESEVMVVDPTLDYNSSGESANEELASQSGIDISQNPEEPMPESFCRNVAMCQYCDQAFVTEENCKEHEQTYHDPKLPFKCVECSLVFAERPQFIQHTKQVHGNDKPYQCPQCEKSFGRRSDLRKHAIVHTGIRPYQCNYCQKNFSRNTNLSKHLRIHAGQKPHVCPYCPRSFVAKGDLHRHAIIHSGMKPFTCGRCPLSFARRDKLINHELAMHGISSTQNIPENNCETDMVVNVNPFSNIAASPTSLGYDLPCVPDHISGEGSFATNKLPRSPYVLAKQNSSPAKPKPVSKRNKPKNIKCHQCPKRFSSLDAYKTHVSIAHIGSRVFQCKICFKKFIRKKELDRHVTIHSGMKPFSCSQCDKTFTRKDKLVKHESSHTCLVESMPCIECGAVFEVKADLVAHIKSHFSEDFERNCQEADLDMKNGFDFHENIFNLNT